MTSWLIVVRSRNVHGVWGTYSPEIIEAPSAEDAMTQLTVRNREYWNQRIGSPSVTVLIVEMKHVINYKVSVGLTPVDMEDYVKSEIAEET